MQCYDFSLNAMLISFYRNFTVCLSLAFFYNLQTDNQYAGRRLRHKGTGKGFNLTTCHQGTFVISTKRIRNFWVTSQNTPEKQSVLGFK